MRPADTTPSSGADMVPAAAAGVRGAVRRRPRVTAGLSLLVILSVGAYLTWFYWPQPRVTRPTRAWYTVDDGATRFADDAERVPPFDHGGRPAVRLHLYTCDGGKTVFIGYLQKLPEETLQKYRDKGVDPATVDDDELAGNGGWLVKRPGDGGAWVNSEREFEAYREVVGVRCPGGKGDVPVEVFPPDLPGR